MYRRARISLLIALGLSVLLHLAILPLLRSPAEPQPEETAGPVALETPWPTPKPTPRPTPTPTPTPTPKPTPKPHRTPPPTPAPHVRRTVPHPRVVRVAHQSARRHLTDTPAKPGQPQANGFAPGTAPAGNAPGGNAPGGNAPGDAGVTGTPTPTVSQPSPPATHPPSCAKPNAAAVTLDAVVPETPTIAQQQGISGDVTVLVSLDANSRVTNVRIVNSASALLNDAALRAARASTFRTEVRDCRPIAADYAFIVEFTAQ